MKTLNSKKCDDINTLLKDLKKLVIQNSIAYNKLERIQAIFNKTEIDFLKTLKVGDTYFTHNILGVVIDFKIAAKDEENLLVVNENGYAIPVSSIYLTYDQAEKFAR